MLVMIKWSQPPLSLSNTTLPPVPGTRLGENADGREGHLAFPVKGFFFGPFSHPVWLFTALWMRSEVGGK